MRIRFYLDPDTGLPHIFSHGVTEEEVEDVLRHPGEDVRGHNDSRLALGQAENGKYLKVVYVPDGVPGSVFVITAYPLTGKALAAHKRRRTKKRRR